MGRAAPRSDGGSHVEEQDASSRRAGRAALVCVLAAIMALSPLTSAVQTAFAAQETGYVQTGRDIRYGGGGKTSEFTVNGAMAYCSDPMYDTPQSGYYPIEDAKTRVGFDGVAHPISALKAVVYYGWGGPGFDKSMWPAKDWDGSEITDEEFYAYTHVLVSDHMWRNGAAGLLGTSTAFKRWYCHVTRICVGHSRRARHERKRPGVPGLKKGAPDDFRVLKLDTGYNSIYTLGRRSQTILTFEPEVTVNFTKCSADAEFTGSNPEYSVAGAEYDIFSASDDAKVDHIVMDESGHASLKSAGTSATTPWRPRRPRDTSSTPSKLSSPYGELNFRGAST